MADYTKYQDEQLLQLLKNEDDKAFAEIYDRYWNKLYFIAHKKLQSAADAKEIVQEVFLALWKQRASAAIQSLSMYLAGMVRYMVYRHISNKDRMEHHLNNFQANRERSYTPAPDFDNKQLIDILTQFSESLPEKYKIVFIHHKLLDQPLSQVAEELGVSVRTAETYVTKVMQLMRKNREILQLYMALFI